MSISGTEQAARGQAHFQSIFSHEGYLYAAILITIRRADHFEVKVHVLNTFSLTSSFWVSGHFETDLSHSGSLEVAPR